MPGVGKSTLVATWLAEVARGGGCTVLQGRALDLCGDSEPFGPLIQMMADHAQAVGTERVARDLQCWAPCWLAQLPTLTSMSRIAQLQVELYRSGEGRMRREVVELISQWSTQGTVVLVLEDLQWADSATLDCLALLAKRARLFPLVIVTTRRLLPLRASGEPPARGLAGPPVPDDAVVLKLPGFGAAEARAYLSMRLPEVELRDDQIGQLLLLTEGLPLFLKAVADGCLQGQLPEAVRRDGERLISSMYQMLRRVVVDRVASMSVELRSLVDLACCMAEVVPVPVMALALEVPEQAVEDGCQSLVRMGLFSPHPVLVPWQGQRVVKAYAVAHALYREALFGELPTSLLMALSSRISAALHADQAGQRGAMPQLVPLYTRLGMHEEAAAAMRLSGMRSLGRFSTRHAVKALQSSLEQLKQLPDPTPTLAVQLETCWDLSRAMMIELGPTDERVEAVRDQIDILAPQVGTLRARFLQNATLCARFVYGGRADLAQQPASQLSGLAASLGNHEQALAQLWLGNVATAHGRLEEAATAFRTCLALPLASLGLAGLDARAIATTQLTWLQAMTGNIADFRTREQALEEEVRSTRSAYLRVVASFWMADALRQLGCVDAAQERYRQLLELCSLYDSASFRDQAQLGLLACTDPVQRDVAALVHLTSSSHGRRPTWSDHMVMSAAIEGLMAQQRFDRAHELLEAFKAVDRHWPLYTPDRLRLQGDLAHALGQPTTAQGLWNEALALDLRRGFMPGVLRHLRRRRAAQTDTMDSHARTRFRQMMQRLAEADLGHPELLPLKALRETLDAETPSIG